MLTLYSYPELFGVADNNPFGLKVYAFLKLCGLAFRHEHILDSSKAPRGQLPYLVDGDATIGDSDAIINHLISRNTLTIDRALTPDQRDTDLLVRRMLDDLYWVMSYSRCCAGLSLDHSRSADDGKARNCCRSEEVPTTWQRVRSPSSPLMQIHR
jgi:hypothetical protein